MEIFNFASEKKKKKQEIVGTYGCMHKKWISLVSCDNIISFVKFCVVPFNRCKNIIFTKFIRKLALSLRKTPTKGTAFVGPSPTCGQLTVILQPHPTQQISYNNRNNNATSWTIPRKIWLTLLYITVQFSIKFQEIFHSSSWARAQLDWQTDIHKHFPKNRAQNISKHTNS